MPATFIRMMDSILCKLKWHTCLCYLDDIVVFVFSSDFPTHLVCLQQVLTCLANASLKLNLKNCHFSTRRLTILGHIASKEGVLTNLAKLCAVPGFPKQSSA